VRAGVDERNTMLKEKAPVQSCARHTKNFWTRCVGLTSKSEKLVRIKMKERERKECKKAFGVQYMDLVQSSGVTDAKLQDCFRKSKNALAVLEQEIIELKIGIERVDEKTRSKIQKRSSSNRATHAQLSQPTGEMTPTVVESNPFANDYVVVPPAHVAPSAPSEELLYG